MKGIRKEKTLFGGFVLFLVISCAGIAFGQQGRGMAIPADALPQELRQLDVADYYVPSNFREVGVVHALNGRIVVVHRADSRAFFGKPGDRIHENDELYTLDNSRCRILFLSDDVVNIAPDTRFAVETFQDLRGDKEKDSIFTMARGKAMFYALRLFRYKEARFKVNTPTAIVGVRGTKFGIDVFNLGRDNTASGPLRVADRGRGFDALLAQAGGQGPMSGTLIACGDGSLDVMDPATGQPLAVVNANEDFNTLTGEKTFDPANRTLNRIQEASRVLDEDEEDDFTEPTDPGVEEDTDAGEDTSLQDAGDITDNVTDVTNLETGTGTESQYHDTGSFTPFVGTESNPLMGYFSAFLFYRGGAHAGEVRDAFASSSLQKLEPLDSAYSYGVINPSDNVTASEGPADEDVGEVTLAGNSSGPFSIEGPAEYLGQNSYLQWGYHKTDTTPTPVVDSTNYQLINKFWFVEGYPTAPMDLAGLSGDYNYSGVVHGTYYDPSGTADLSGKYSSKVNFASAYVYDFLMNASGGGHSISFTQSGTAGLSPDGGFHIHNPNGTFRIDGSAVDYWAVNGAHFGPGAAEQGGAYAAACPSTNVGSYGIFAGKR